MQIYQKRLNLESDVAVLLRQHKNIGFVPTMGALHQGHLALIKNAMDQNDVVVVSIFVNPTQFNNSEDLINYPRTLEADVAVLSKLSDDIIVFVPSPDEIYGDEIISDTYDFGGIEHQMEGKYRLGHFEGVGTVLKHLFHIISPTKAYFGEKDFQQLQIVKKLVAIENMSVEIIGCPTYREKSGLALSSRNKRLNKEQFKESAEIYKILQQVQTDFGTKSVLEITEWVNQQFEKNKILNLEYFEITNISDLKSTVNIQNDIKYRAFIAVFAGEVRLIDNIALN